MAAASMDFGPVFQSAGAEWGVDPALLQSLAGQETGGLAKPDGAVSPKGAQGRMQIMPGTAQDLGVTDPSDPVQNIFGAAKYMSQLLDRYQGTADPASTAVAAYNAGPNRVDAVLAGKATLPAETAAYVPGVANRYRALTGGQQQASAAPAPSTPAAPSVDDTATAGLNAAMARLPAATSAASATPSTPAPTANSAAPGGVDYFAQAKAAAQSVASTGGGPVDYFSMAKAAALGAPGAATPPVATQPTATPAQAPAGAPAGATGATGPIDYFSMAKAAALAGPGAPQQFGGAVTPVSAPGTAQPSPSASQAAPGIMGTIGNYVGPAAMEGYAKDAGNAVYQASEGAGHAVLQASRGLYGAIDAGNQAVPVPGQTLGGLIDPAKAIPNLDAEAAQYQQSGVGNTVAGKVGTLAGQTILTLPVIGGAGAVGAAAALPKIGGALAAGVDAVSPTAGSIARGAGNLLAGTASSDNALINAAVRPVALAANGAVVGGTANALTGDPGQSIGQNALTGAEYGAVLGPVGGALATGVSRGYNAIKGAIQPFTTAGRGAIADNALAQMALKDNGPLTADATTYVPGSTPTLAQATNNAGLAGAERAVSAVRPQQFATQAQDNNQARTDLLAQLTGTPTDIAAAQVARDNTALPAMLDPVQNATAPANAAPVVQTIDDILASPAGQRDAVQSALGNIRSKLTTPIPFNDRVDTALNSVTGAINSGNIDPGLWAAREALVSAQSGGAQQASTLARLQATTSSDPAVQAVIDQAKQTIGTANRVESDPAQLYGIRQAIGDALSPLATRSGSDAQLASNELLQVKKSLDNSIENAAPGFKSGVADYADQSQPINAMQYLQSKNYTTADDTVTLAKVTSALNDIEKQQALPGARDAKAIPQSTIDGLQSIRADLLRQQNSRTGLAVGSNTFQNLGVNSAMAGLGAPVATLSRLASAVPVVGNALTGTIGRAYAGQNDAIMDAVVNRLANPAAGASVLKRASDLRAQQNAGPSGANRLFVTPGVNYLAGGGR